MGDKLIRRICDAVAAESDTDVLALPPLYDAIDPSIFDAVCERQDGTALDPLSLIVFTYHGYVVTVDAGGQVHLDPETGTSTG